MKFRDTLLFKMLATPKEEWVKGGIYRVILLMPYLLIVYTFGIVMAIMVDLWVAVFEEAE